MKSPLTSHRHHRAFTLIELIITLTIIGILTSFLIPSMMSSIALSNQDSTINMASTLDLAKTGYLRKQSTAALAAWAGCTNDEQKYQLIRPYLYAPKDHLGDGTTSTDYTPKGYLFELNDLSEPTTVIRLSDSQIIAGSNAVYTTNTP